MRGKINIGTIVAARTRLRRQLDEHQLRITELEEELSALDVAERVFGLLQEEDAEPCPEKDGAT